MTTTRIHDLAAEFGISSEQLIGMLKELDIFVRSHLSPLKPEQVALMRARWEREKRARAVAHLGIAEPSATRDLAAGEDVSRHRQVGKGEHLLIDHADAALERLARTAEVETLVVPVNRAGVGLDDAGENLQQRRLAGAVLAHERVRFAFAHGEADAAQGPDGAERFADVTELEGRLGRHARENHTSGARR